VTPKFPPRRLLAVAAALALMSAQAEANGQQNQSPAPTAPESAFPACPLGSFHCAPRPLNYAMCRPNALLEFYDPSLGRDPTLRNTSPTLVSAQHVDSSNQSIYHLSGNVRMERADQLLQADDVRYNDGTTDYDARGNVRYQEAGQLLAGSHMRGNTAASRGTADDVRYQMLEARGNGVAKQGEMLDAMHTHYSSASYSTCDVGHHVWEFRAKSITLDKDTGVGVARNSTMRIGNVPVVWLPYMSFPLDDRRKSGFLYPTLGNSSRSGIEISTPYYLNLAPNYDATLDPRYYSDRGAMLAGEFRYLIPGSNGQLNVEYLAHDRGDSDGLEDTEGKDRYLVNFKDSSRLWKGWSFVSSINRVSDSSYIYDFGNSLSHTPIYSLASTATIVGSGEWWNASIGGTVYQNTNPFGSDASLQYRELPAAAYTLQIPINRWLETGVDAETVAFRKSGFVEGQREDIYPYVGADFGDAAWFVRPKLAYRYTAYQLSSNYQDYGYSGRLSGNANSPFAEKTPSRALPIASIDSGLVFTRSASLFGSSYTQTLEPRLYYLYVPYRDQSNLPLFDTRVMSFDDWQLFAPNRFSGADRQMNANNLTAAISTRLLDSDGIERVSASFGQIRYFTPQRVQLTTQKPTDWSGSDYVAELGLRLNDRWRMNSSYQWSPNIRHTELGLFELQRRIGDRGGIVNFSYRYRREELEQYGVSGVFPLSDRWRLLGAWAYALPVEGASAQSPTGTVDAMLGVEYDSCCVALRLVGRNYVNESYYGNTPAPSGTDVTRRDNSIMFEVEFKGLGSTGGQITPLLRRDILGYQ